MLNIHLRLALRQLQKNKGFTALNIFGLTFGLATFLLISLYIMDERSYDRYNVHADHIIRLNTDITSNGEVSALADAAPVVAATLRSHYPEVEATTRIAPYSGLHFYKDHTAIAEPRVAWADDNIFEFFTLPLLEGDPQTALKDPHSIVLTESSAIRYFHTTHAIGRTIENADDSSRFVVTAVMRDFPAQSSFRFDFLVSIHSSGQLDKNPNFYSMYPMSTFVRLRPGADRAAFDKKLAGLMRGFAKDYAEMEDGSKGAFKMVISGTPLTDIHLYSHRTDELGTNGSIQYVRIFSSIAIFVLLIAGINFMNLSTARSAGRAREVGVRKVLGSLRMQLIGQFLSEALLLTIAAALLAVGLTWLSLPWFNHLTGKELVLSAAVWRWLLPSLLIIIVVVGLFSGAWPAFFLSAFRPVQVLKDNRGNRRLRLSKERGTKLLRWPLALGGKGSGLRSTLVVLQFSISIFLIVGTIVVYRQLNYIRHRDPGYSRDQMLIVKNVDGLTHPATLQKQFQQLPGVLGVSMTDFLPTGTHRWHNYGQVEGKGMYMQTELWVVDDQYIPTMSMHVEKGRNFLSDRGTDSTAIILNETAAAKFGIAADPIGKTIHYSSFKNIDFHVIGVVKDFNFTSVRSMVQPLALICYPEEAPAGFAIHIAAGHTPDVLEKLTAGWKAFAPSRAFSYTFMDEDFDNIYKAEQHMGGLIAVLTTLVIFIACLGLFGLAAYAAEQRAKEIGIRKILGAGVPSIVGLLSRDFARLIALALCIAVPLSWWLMHRWLEDFAYRTDINAWIFVTAAAIVFSIACLTTLYQSVKAAVANPVTTLKAE